MELKELYDKTLALFKCNEFEQLKNEIIKCVTENRNDCYDSFLEIVDGDLSHDWMQKIFQYYGADRKKKGQDFTPVSIAKLVANLAEGKEITDMCAGSGALTIQKWNQNKNITFNLYELDSDVIPFLLFNLAVRNIDAKVYNMDVLSGEVFAVYKCTPGQKYGTVEVL